MSSREFRLLVGLGNPGEKYQQTRHNIGFMALEKLASQHGGSFRKRNKLFGLLAEIRFNQEALYLLRPNTFMNESGRSIRASLDWFGLDINQLLVLVDDMDLPLGRLRFRNQGSSGGHNGLKSTIQHLGTQNFSRLRIGIGPPEGLPKDRKAMTIPHVLGSFTKQEEPLVDEVLNEVLIGLQTIKQLGIEQGITRINSYKPNEVETINR